MNLNKYILIIGTDEEGIKKALQQFSNTYAENGVTSDIILDKSLSKENVYVVQVSGDIDIDNFKYLVNYLDYPEGIDYKVEVRGYWTIGKDDGLADELINKRVMFYISPNDTEGDNVFGIFKGGNKTIKFGFSKGNEFQELEKKDKDFQEPELEAEDFSLLETISPKPSAIKEKKGSGCMVTFTVIVLVGIGLSLLL